MNIKEKHFDPSEKIRGIQQLLISDKKKIAFLFGAGTSLSGRLIGLPYVPAIAEMTEKIDAAVLEDEKYKYPLTEIKSELEALPHGYNIEALLSNIEDKIRIIGDGTLNGLNKKDFEDLAKKIKTEMHDIVSIHTKHDESELMQLKHYGFAEWIKNADRKYAIEIFTTNYDYLFEKGLEAKSVPYYDGFTGSYMPFFNAESLEDMSYLPQQTKLWKIHGSLGLIEEKTEKGNKIIRSSSASEKTEQLIIYPSTLKYNNSKKMPYAAFIDRLYEFLKQEDAVLFVCGHSFGDEHINERILSALNRSSTSHVFAFYYDIMHDAEGKKYTLTADSKLAQMAINNRRLTLFGTRNAIIGSVYGAWKLSREPDKDDSLNIQLYFDEDAPYNNIAEINDEQKGNELWTGTGELILPNFNRFIEFLKDMIPDNDWEGV